MAQRNRIGKYRSERRMTQKDLSVQTGIPRSVVSMIESDKYMPSAEQLHSIAKALECAPELLYQADVMMAVYGISCDSSPSKPKRRTVNVRISCELAAMLDELCMQEGFGSRDEAARYLIRDGIRRFSGSGESVELCEPDNEQNSNRRLT